MVVVAFGGDGAPFSLRFASFSLGCLDRRHVLTCHIKYYKNVSYKIFGTNKKN